MELTGRCAGCGSLAFVPRIGECGMQCAVVNREWVGRGVMLREMIS